MSLNTIRKIFFTNVIIENLFIFLIKSNILVSFVKKMLPSNVLYKANTYRKVNRNNINYKLDINDYQEWLIYFMSNQDSSLEVLKYLGDSSSIIDIGANIGQTSLEIHENRLKNNTPFEIICFEPFPQSYAKLINNLNLNILTHIKAENIGLGQKSEKAKMFKDCITNSGGNRMVYNHVENTTGVIEVQITTLDQYLQSHRIDKVDFIKIDVEGFEYSVLKGAENTLKKDKPNLFIELDDENLKKQGSSALELILFLENLNYNIIDYENKFTVHELKSISIHTDIWCN